MFLIVFLLTHLYAKQTFAYTHTPKIGEISEALFRFLAFQIYIFFLANFYGFPYLIFFYVIIQNINSNEIKKANKNIFIRFD
jgi:hypothetical protein